jgi:signal transduction histidine kinase
LPSGRLLLVVPSPTVAARLLGLHQRVMVALIVFALLLLLALVLVLLLRPSAPVESGSRPPWVFAKAEMGSLQHLARTSVTQGAELARERDERMRAQEEAYVNQVRLNQALEEKIRLGRDLHDGIIQSLYATGLTLENVRDLVDRNPPEAVKRLEGSIELLNTAIRDVRAYITGLKSDPARDAGLSRIVERIAAELKAGREVAFTLEIDDFAASRLPAPAFADVVQIVREAVSNALRHGAARHIAVRLHEGDGALALLVQDDGAGFAADGGSRGHGLANMRGRAESAGGSLQVESAPGRGTRVVLTLPLTTLSS